MTLLLAGGQFISVLLSLTGFISSNLAERGFIFPVLQSTGFYFLLSLYLLRWPFPIRMPIYLYALLALLDVEANFLAVSAYQYTDITSVLLLNSLTIPWVVILSFFLLKRTYSRRQIVSVVTCIAGLGLCVASDTIRERWSDDASRPKAWVGDLICVGSSFLYACQNVLQEYLLKRLGDSGMGTTTEYLGMLGLFGFVISNIQWLALEREDVLNEGMSLWSTDVAFLFVGFSLTMMTLYVTLTWFIGKFDASVFNMNILTSGVYGIIIEFMDRKTTPRIATDWMYIIAYVLVVAGVLVYSMDEREVPTAPDAVSPKSQFECSRQESLLSNEHS